jgi:osmotically-inducible protein OsmY
MLRLVAAFGRCSFFLIVLGCSSGRASPPPAVAQNIAPAPDVPDLKRLFGLNPWSVHGGIPGSDLSIIKRVLHALMADPGITVERVDLDSQGGVVTLKGVLASPLAARRAIAAAERVPGVVAVADELEVHPPPRPDHELEEDVRLLLRTNTATAGRKLDASVKDGMVVLEGSVRSLAEKKLAEEAVLAVTGVRGVEGALQIATDPPRADQEIRDEVVRRLRYDGRVDARDVAVAVEESVVRLTGTVGSAAERKAIREVAEVRGAAAVDSRKLHVDPSRSNRRGAPRSTPSDAELALAVQAALDHDPRLGSSELSTFVAAGAVRLHGRVDSPAARRAAEQTAASIFGVNQVVNEAQVRPQLRVADGELLRAIRRRLRAHPYVDATNLEVSVRGSAASLRGTVKNEFERDQALEAAATTSGVVSIVDRLRVQTPRPGRSADSQLKREIASRLARDPSPQVKRVEIEVIEGVVTLSGQVEDQAAHDRTMVAATDAGARRIVDDLKIVPASGTADEVSAK